MTLVTEIFQSITFKPGTKIIPMSKFAPTNTYYRQFFVERASKFAEEMKQKNKKVEEVNNQRLRENVENKEAAE